MVASSKPSRSFITLRAAAAATGDEASAASKGGVAEPPSGKSKSATSGSAASGALCNTEERDGHDRPQQSLPPRSVELAAAVAGGKEQDASDDAVDGGKLPDGTNLDKVCLVFVFRLMWYLVIYFRTYIYIYIYIVNTKSIAYILHIMRPSFFFYRCTTGHQPFQLQ